MNDKNIVQMPDGYLNKTLCSSLFCYPVYSRYGDVQPR
ncbi:sugar:proton symporter [Salmonella enterica subsp. arizonae]|nr:sugar:proton symporter [Salmonella enterica subsp. arizonae]